jgi:GntR family transcriptional repressor for pyruvate dehydrogenase complex
MVSDALFRNVGSKDKLVDRVVATIQQLILDGQMEPGMRLPPERDFAERLGVSRTVLREAVRILVTKGLLETRHGVGTVVRQPTTDQFLEPLSLLLRTYDLSIEQLYQVRSILEVGTVRLAAANATAEDLEALHQIVDEMAASTEDIPRFIALDDAYHHTLALAAHNPLLVLLSHTIGSIMHEVREQVHKYSVIYRLALPDHLEILTAVEARDADAAVVAMQKHLDNARRFQEEYVALERGRVVSSNQ